MLHIPITGLDDLTRRRTEKALTIMFGEPVSLTPRPKIVKPHAGACICPGCREAGKAKRAQRSPRQPWNPRRSRAA